MNTSMLRNELVIRSTTGVQYGERLYTTKRAALDDLKLIRANFPTSTFKLYRIRSFRSGHRTAWERVMRAACDVERIPVGERWLNAFHELLTAARALGPHRPEGT